MVLVKMVHVFPRDHVDLAIPVQIQRFQLVILIFLFVGETIEIGEETCGVHIQCFEKSKNTELFHIMVGL